LRVIQDDTLDALCADAALCSFPDGIEAEYIGFAHYQRLEKAFIGATVFMTRIVSHLQLH
jgi:hypothetical protein